MGSGRRQSAEEGVRVVMSVCEVRTLGEGDLKTLV